jgi:hypothetical protein
MERNGHENNEDNEKANAHIQIYTTLYIHDTFKKGGMICTGI